MNNSAIGGITLTRGNTAGNNPSKNVHLLCLGTGRVYKGQIRAKRF